MKRKLIKGVLTFTLLLAMLATMANPVSVYAEENEPDGEKQIWEEAFLQLETMRKNVLDLDYREEQADYGKRRYGIDCTGVCKGS